MGSIPTQVLRFFFQEEKSQDLYTSATVMNQVLLRHFEIVELSLACHLHIELTPSGLFDEKTHEVLGAVN